MRLFDMNVNRGNARIKDTLRIQLYIWHGCSSQDFHTSFSHQQCMFELSTSFTVDRGSSPFIKQNPNISQPCYFIFGSPDLPCIWPKAFLVHTFTDHRFDSKDVAWSNNPDALIIYVTNSSVTKQRGCHRIEKGTYWHNDVHWVNNGRVGWSHDRRRHEPQRNHSL